MKTYFLHLFFILICATTSAQIKDTLPNFNDDYFLVKDGDTLMIKLNEVVILPKHKFRSRNDINYYLWFRKKVFKAYPYAKMASERLDSLQTRLASIKSKRKRRRYTKRIQKYVEGEFTDQIKKMTRTEGRVLIKLIHRQTGKTAFDNIKELRSGWKAFWYNTTANLFKISLKDEYHPETNNEDYLIEDILQRAFVDEQLQAQEHKLSFDATTVLAKQKGKVDVDKYKKMFAKIRKKRGNKKKKTKQK